MNRKKFILAWLALIAVAALAAAATHWLLCGRTAVTQESLTNTSYLTQALDLSADQAAAVGKLQAEVGAKLAEYCERHCAARAQLALAIAGVTNGEPLIKAMSAAYEESERLTWAHIQQVRALLTPAQQARYDALIERCVSGACNMSNVANKKDNE
jgi:hypothetical protein